MAFSILPYPKAKSPEEIEANRKFYLNKDRKQDKVSLPGGGAAYLSEYEVNGQKRYLAFIFLMKQSKPYSQYYYKTVEAQMKAVEEARKSSEATLKLKAERKEANKPSNAGVAVGDIFVGSGGYDQTNVEALQVVELIGKSSVKVRPVGFKSSKEDSNTGWAMSDYVKPVKDNFLDAPPAKLFPDNPDYTPDVQAENRANYYASKGGVRQVRGGYVKSTWGSASKWDGHRSYYSSWYA